MSDLVEAVAAIKHGYEVEELTMYDDKMIGHVETLSGHHDTIIDALAKASVFDEIMKASKDGGFEKQIEDKIAEKRAEILASVPARGMAIG